MQSSYRFYASKFSSEIGRLISPDELHNSNFGDSWIEIN